MMTQPVQGPGRGIAIFGSIPVGAICSGMSCLKSLQCLVDHAPAAMALVLCHTLIVGLQI